jgi:hypothetical protein
MGRLSSQREGSNMSIKLTETQGALLSAASQRGDHWLTPPTGARSGPARKSAAKLLEEGLVREVRARKDAPVWRRDEDTDQAFALKLTAAGLKAIAADAGRQHVGEARRTPSGDAVGSDATPRWKNAPNAGSGAVSSPNFRWGYDLELRFCAALGEFAAKL